MKYEILGGTLPVVVCTLADGESMINEGGSMSWMSPNMHMEISSNGGVGKAIGRMFAGEATIELSVHFNKRLGAGLFGGEGFILQKVSGSGIAFAEFDGHVVEYDLDAGQQIVVDTGHLAAMDASCSMDIQTVKGAKNVLFGGEGLFLTNITGPGRVWLQTMPLPNVAGALRRYLASNN